MWNDPGNDEYLDTINSMLGVIIVKQRMIFTISSIIHTSDKYLKKNDILS